MVERKRNILSNRERIVKSGLLEEEAHLLSDFAELVKGQAGNILPMDADRARVGLFEAYDDPQQHALAGSASPEHGKGFTAVYFQADPIEHFLASERFVQVLDGEDGRAVVLLNLLWFRRDFISCGHCDFKKRLFND
jgi:hypothetical protein